MVSAGVANAGGAFAAPFISSNIDAVVVGLLLAMVQPPDQVHSTEMHQVAVMARRLMQKTGPRTAL